MTAVLVFGRTGQVARALARLAPDNFQVQFLDRRLADLTDAAALRALISTAKPDAIVLAAAYTAVDQAETDSQTAWRVNAIAPSVIGAMAAELDCPVVHLSTDYVFDGLGDLPFVETDHCGPINVYGASKLAGEIALAGTGVRHVIFRTSWVYDGQGQNFLRTMLALRDRVSLDIVADQFGRPTHADQIARTIWQTLPQLLDGYSGGLFHLTGNGPYTTWHGFASQIFGTKGPELFAVTTDKFPRPARRPRNSRLDLTKIEQDLNVVTNDWREELARCMQGMD